MKKVQLVMNSVVGAVVLTLVTATAALLYLMFSTGEQPARHEGLFGSIFFESREVRPDVTGVSMGVDNPTGLIVLFLVLIVVLLTVQITYRALKQYRAQLLEERAHGQQQNV